MDKFFPKRKSLIFKRTDDILSYHLKKIYQPFVLDGCIGNTLENISEWQKLNKNQKLFLLKFLLINDKKLWKMIKPSIMAKNKQTKPK